MRNATTTADFFEHIYRQAPDPWNFAASDYEQGRYRSILDALGGQRYVRAFEPGCSIGILTALLAPLCDRVEAIDISPTAVSRASERCRELANVNVSCGALPESIPAGKFDLIVFSEIGYYFRRAPLLELGNRLISKISPSGTFLAAHWLGKSPDHLLSGDEVHNVLGSIPGLRNVHAERHTGFRLDRWERL
ncbi:MAG: SAM-dependent methyltransferase [Candidatus Sulfotelmatobacter sp.]|jgi:SAM-dependent methyltransferase